MTVQDLINKAVKLLNDISNISSYGDEYLDSVSTIVGQLVEKCIGVNKTLYRTSVDSGYTMPYTPADANYKPVELPNAITDTDQIVDIELDYYELDTHVPVEIHESKVYLLVDAYYYGNVSVWYLPVTPNFTQMSDILPISDRAANNVAKYGLAAEIALINDDADKYNVLEGKFAEAKFEWRRRNAQAARQIKNVYNY